MLSNSLEIVGLTDVGKVRTYNEDALIADSENGVVAVADGMGGHRAGNVASQLAVKTVADGLKQQIPKLKNGAGDDAQLQAVKQVIKQANRAIFDTAKSKRNYQGMGTTLAMALFFNNRVTFGHIGDSRIYRLRDEKLKLLTRDDSLVRDQVELGLIAAEDAGVSHNRNLVTGALGSQEKATIHYREDDVLPGDIFLLCSDGLSDIVDDGDIELIVKGLQVNLPLVAQHLIQAANDHGGFDNISVVLVKVKAPFPVEMRKNWTNRLFGWFK